MRLFGRFYSADEPVPDAEQDATPKSDAALARAKASSGITQRPGRIRMIVGASIGSPRLPFSVAN